MGARSDVLERASGIRFVLLDVDGVLTDGGLRLDGSGAEGKTFHVRDGLAIRLGQRAGLAFGLLTGRRSEVVARRAAELDLTEVHQGVYNKLERFEELRVRLRLEAAECCYMGDDLVDLPVMRRVGLAAAPADAVAEVAEAAHVITEAAGGRGAVRELVELLLRPGDRWARLTREWTRD